MKADPPPSMIASARMYSWSPSLAAAWQQLLDWVAATAKVPLEVIGHRGDMSLDELWARPDMGCVFMCGYPWALLDDRPRLLAAPVPSPPRYGGRPVYFTDLIVRAEGPHTALEDTFGGVFAYSTEHSHSGYNAPRHHLLSYRTPERQTFYREVLGPFIRQRPVIDAVADGRADIGAVDSYGLDLLKKHAPDVASRVRVIASTAPAPSPPLVASRGTDGATSERVKAALTSAHQASEIAPTLEALLLSRFVPISEDDFEVFLERDRAAVSAGYPKLA